MACAGDKGASDHLCVHGISPFRNAKTSQDAGHSHAFGHHEAKQVCVGQKIAAGGT